MSVTPKILVLSGYGLNTEMETKYSFELVGAEADIVHVNDIINNKHFLKDYQIIAFTGGFSYGDDTGSGNALANRIKNHLGEQLQEFISGDGLAIGICNGFQVITNLGLVPALDDAYGTQQVALMHNTSARYIDRWVDLEFYGTSPWVKDLKQLPVPIAHGEGNFFTQPEILERLRNEGLVAARYVKGEVCDYQSLPANPNGALDDIAGITDGSGRFFGLMPHPERAVDFTQLVHWPFLKQKMLRSGDDLPEHAPALQVFQNGVNYFL